MIFGVLVSCSLFTLACAYPTVEKRTVLRFDFTEIEKNVKKFIKTLDKAFFYVIILKCIIFAFFLWGFSALFSRKYVEIAQKIIACFALLHKSPNAILHSVKHSHFATVNL